MAYFRAAIGGGGGGGGGQTASGSVSLTTTAQKIVTGFKPKQVCMMINGKSARFLAYDERISDSRYSSANGTSVTNGNIGNSANVNLVSIDNDGFTVKAIGSGHTGTYYYFAIG